MRYRGFAAWGRRQDSRAVGDLKNPGEIRDKVTGVGKDHGLTSAERRREPTETEKDLAVDVEPLTFAAERKKPISLDKMAVMAEVDPDGRSDCGAIKAISISAHRYRAVVRKEHKSPTREDEENESTPLARLVDGEITCMQT